MRAWGWTAATIVLAVAAPAFAHKPTVTTFTYSVDIYPIFAAKCGSCHRSGGVAPMSLLTYQDAYPWAVSIKNEILNLAMPPWFADERYGAFKHRSALTAKEMDTIVDWCLGGSPEGEPVSGTAHETSEAWALGEPDLALTMPDVVRLDENTSEATEELTMETGLTADRYVRAVDFRPGSASVVRSAMIHVAGEEQPLATWIPGQAPEALPEGHGWRLPAGADIMLRIHYEKTWLDDGTVVEDRSTLGLYFHETPSAQMVETIAVDAATPYTVAKAAEIVAILPRVDSSVEDLIAEVVLPDGSREQLIRLFQPDPDWPRKYWLVERLPLPSGSRVEVRVSASESVSPLVLLDIVSP